MQGPEVRNAVRLDLLNGIVVSWRCTGSDDVLQQSANHRRNHGSTPVQKTVIVDEFRQVNPIALEAFFFERVDESGDELQQLQQLQQRLWHDGQEARDAVKTIS